MKKIISFLLFLSFLGCWGSSTTSQSVQEDEKQVNKGFTVKVTDFTKLKYYDISNPTLSVLEGYYPSMLYINGTYMLWYTDKASPTSRVVLKTSTDFINFTDGGVISIAGMDITKVHHVQVVYLSDQAKYRIYYWHTDNLYGIEAIRTAESVDGINWTNDQVITQDASYKIITGTPGDNNRGSYGPVAIFYNSNPENSGPNPTDKSPFKYKFAMYYDGTTGGEERVYLAVSNDGINFYEYFQYVKGDLVPSPVLDVGASGEWDENYAGFGVIFWDNASPQKMHYYYSGGQTAMHEGVGYASSTNGVDWVKLTPNAPILPRNAGTWNSKRCYAPGIVVDFENYFGMSKDEAVPFRLIVSGRDDDDKYAFGNFVPSSLVREDLP